MLKHTYVSRSCRFSTGNFFRLVFSILLMSANNAWGQNTDRTITHAQNTKTAQSSKELLPVRVGEQWRAVGRVRTLDAAQSTVLPDADVYLEYGLQRLFHRVYTNGKTKATVEVLELEFISGAYGSFTFNRQYLQPNQHLFHEGRYLVRISIEPPSSSLDQTLVEAIKPNLVGEAGQFPFLPSHLPEQDRIANSEKYIVGPKALANLENFRYLKDLVNFEGGTEIAAANYRNGNGRMNLIIIEFHTPQSASDGHTKLQDRFNALPQPEKDKRILKRTGNYVVEAANIYDLAAAQNLVGQIKYEAKVYWAGRKLSDIPLEFRPLDPVALEEMKRTTEVLLRSFYWIGAMLLSAILLGIAAGGALFYWNRYRRRKLGLDDLFSDAGGTLRLNLDDYLLSSEEPEIKQIGKGDNQV